ncbi:MAG: 16S rRNA (guanine(527)-N(7))-methyltransferase RsmG [Burkholderiales bacterium]|nr:16S rRNA (guanine(527)-N(7))-methyltransferase RsmG [Burkholderiales bacterium]
MKASSVSTSELDLLSSGIEQLGLKLNLNQINNIKCYIELLIKWNKTYSLTAITDRRQIIIDHVFDGLSVVAQLKDVANILDVGSGMGIPAVIIAISCPQIKVMAVDCSAKKTAFLTQVAIELKLDNLSINCHKIEQIKLQIKYDAAISRAFTSTLNFIQLLAPLPVKQLLLMKSTNVDKELSQLEGYNYSLHQLLVPFSNKTRYLVKINV